MGEMVTMADCGRSGSGYDDRVPEWETGLPCGDDLTPLSQVLVPPLLATAFNIMPEPSRTSVDVDRASRETFSTFRRAKVPAFPENSFNPFDEKNAFMDLTVDDDGGDGDARKIRRLEAIEEADSASMDDQSGNAMKRQRLVWTPQLHRRFVDVVSHLGIKNAVPKTIMQLMNVEGLTRENVASHLQKYRLYLKRSHEGPNSSTDQLFASTPAPQSSNLHDGGRNGHVTMPIQMSYGPAMVPVPKFGNGHMGMAIDQHAYGMMQQRDWSNGSAVSYPHVAPIDK